MPGASTTAGDPSPATLRHDPAASTPFPLRLSFFLAVALLFWSFVGGALYLVVVQHRLPLQVDALDEARSRLQRGDVKGALREYRMFTALSPFESHARTEMAVLLLRDGRLEEASAAYEALLALQPRDASAVTGLARVRLDQGRPAEAAALYQRALLLVPETPSLHNDAGKAHALAGDLDAAIGHFSAALALAPFPEAAANRDRALAEKAGLARAQDVAR